MMASQFKNYTTDELLKKLKNQKRLAIFHGFIVLFLFIVAGFNSAENGFSFSSFLPLFFLPMQGVFIYEIKKMKKELTLRN
jgi:hypothetical protein|tara:strand:+ start:520 stop:762 length:243 start_codon:yes stop_codon:yes gene_type:complete